MANVTILSDQELAVIKMMRSGKFDVELQAFDAETEAAARELLEPLSPIFGKAPEYQERSSHKWLETSNHDWHDGSQVRATVFLADSVVVRQGALEH